MLHTNFRGSQEWKNENLPLTTGSNEACKLYDAALAQFVGWFPNESLGGMDGTFDKMMKADENFVMGMVFKNGMNLLDGKHSLQLSCEVRDGMKRMIDVGHKTPNLTWREKKHIEALETWRGGWTDKAALVWEEILTQFPTDMLALKFAYVCYFCQGKSYEIRNSFARVFPHWKPNMPFYGELHGMLAFGYEETNMFKPAEEMAKKALWINPRDAWATHTLCHVLWTQGRHQEGIDMMDSTVQNWETGGILDSHNFWHWCLFYVDIGDYESALTAFDKEVTRRGYASGSLRGLVDISSFLFRLEMEGVSVGDRWNKLYETYKYLLHHHVYVFNDLHILLACLGTGKKEAVQEMMESIKTFVREGQQGTNRETTAKVGENVMKAFVAYDGGDFASAVDLILPVRANMASMGGSNAQRDMFKLFLIQAAIKSPKKEHNKLGRNLLNERKMLTINNPMADRLMATVLANHVD